MYVWDALAKCKGKIFGSLDFSVVLGKTATADAGFRVAVAIWLV
jgi:hypothetical protein